MMFTTRMVYLTGVTLESDMEQVSREMLKLGAVDFIKASSMLHTESAKVKDVQTTISLTYIRELKQRIETLIENDGFLQDLDMTVDLMKPLDLEETEGELNRISGELQQLRDKQREFQQEILKLQDMERQVSLFSNLQEGIRENSSYSFIQMKVGTIPPDQREPLLSEFISRPVICVDLGEQGGRPVLLLIYLKKEENKVTEMIQHYSWEETKLPSASFEMKSSAKHDILNKIDNLKREQENLQNASNRVINDNRSWFLSSWTNLHLHEMIIRMQNQFSKTERAILFTGWIPREKKENLEQTISGITGGRYILQWKEVDSFSGQKNVQVPVEIKNPRFLKPFEFLVKNYSTPEYGTVDPTPFVAVSFLVMFGLMFGDAGHGLVIALIGLLASRFGKSAKAGMRQLFTLLTYCGGASIVTGVLFGSYFGYPLIKPLWFNYHSLVAGHGSGNPSFSSIYDVLLITIFFGIAIIGTGLLLNWINRIRKRDWLHLIFDKGGILGGWMYGAGIFAAFFLAGNNFRQLPDPLFLLLGFGIPAFLLFLKEPIELILHSPGDHPGEEKKKFTVATVLNMVMIWIIEMLEIFSGYLANTLSFMRVAGLGIAHVSLMMVFSQIANMIRDSGVAVVPVIILLLGNCLVIALEGLSAGIQSLRLNYYEFFSKYFTGSGKAYSPISLKKR